MNSSGTAGKAAQAVGHVVNFVRNTVSMITNIVAQNYVGAAINGVQLLPYVIAIVVFAILAPFVIFMALPSMVVNNAGERLTPGNSALNSVTHSLVQDEIHDTFAGYAAQLRGEITGLESRFNAGILDSLISTNYSGYARPVELDIARLVRANGVMIDVFWLAALHSVYFANEPANITPEATAQFIAGVFAYQVTERITDVVEATRRNPLTLLITRYLDIEYKSPTQIMQFFGFDEQQIQWAMFMHSVISGGSESVSPPNNPAFIPDSSTPIGITAGRLGEPIANWRNHVTSNFGTRRDPFTNQPTHHAGIDIGRPTGTDIMATADGVVTSVVRSSTGYGYYVVIDHGGGISTLYAHCSSIFVEERQRVSQGEVIAEVGSTGRSTAPHLHFEYRINGRAVNPRNYLS